MAKWASESERVAAYRKRVAEERRVLGNSTGLDVVLAELSDLEERVVRLRRLVMGVVERLAGDPPPADSTAAHSSLADLIAPLRDADSDSQP